MNATAGIYPDHWVETCYSSLINRQPAICWHAKILYLRSMLGAVCSNLAARRPVAVAWRLTAIFRHALLSAQAHRALRGVHGAVNRASGALSTVVCMPKEFHSPEVSGWRGKYVNLNAKSYGMAN